MVCLSPLKAGYRITVSATRRARFVHSDVLAFDASALFSLACVFFRHDIESKDLRNQLVVDALPGRNAVLPQVEFVGTALKLNSIPEGCFCKGAHEAGKVVSIQRQKCNSQLLKPPDALLGLPIEVSHTDYGPLGISFQCTGEAQKGAPMEIKVGETGKEHGVVSPNDFLGTDTVGKVSKGIDTHVNGR